MLGTRRDLVFVQHGVRSDVRLHQRVVFEVARLSNLSTCHGANVPLFLGWVGCQQGWGIGRGTLLELKVEAALYAAQYRFIREYDLLGA